MPTTGKSDPRDAFLIAERLRIGRLLAPFELDVLYAPLQRLTRYRVHLTKALAREKSYFLSLLFVQFSGFSQAEPFGDAFGTTCQALLEQIFDRRACAGVARGIRAVSFNGMGVATSPIHRWSPPASSGLRVSQLRCGQCPAAASDAGAGDDARHDSHPPSSS